MTFHAGNGVTLTKEEENLSEEERQRVIRAKEEVNRKADEELEKSLGGAREYYKDDNYKPLTNEEVDSALAFVKQKENENIEASSSEPTPKASAGDGIVQSTGTYGTLKNEDFSAYRVQRDAERKRNQEAIRAGQQAEADKRDELLATGRFFDDGRGNIKMKKEYRQQGVNGDRNTLRHFNKDTEHNTYADATNRMIKAAGQAAFDKSIDSWDDALQIQNAANSPMNKRIAANREEMKGIAKAKEEQGIRKAESNLGIFDGLVAAFDDMKNGGRIEDETVFGGKDAQGRDARWKYNAQGRVIGQADKIKTGRKVRVGYLAKGQIISLNNELEQFGSNMRISGITARQVFNPDFPDKEVSKPMLYVQGVRFDPESKKSVPFGEWMTMDKLYKMGLSNAQKAGGFYASTHSEDAIIDRLGDIFGVRKRKESDPKYRESVAKAKLAEHKAENPNWLTFDERMQLQASQNQNRLAIAQLNAEQRQKAAEAARVLKELGYAIDIDLAEAKAADASARSMANAKTGITNEAKYTPEQIEAEKKRAEEARKRARGKVGSRQANPSSGDNRTMPTVAKDTNSITMPDGKVVKKNETYTDSRGRTMRWVGPGPKDWKIVK